MKKTLKVISPEKCIGCELCIMEIQKQLGKAGLDGSLIRILRQRHSGRRSIEFSIHLDPQVDLYDIEKIKRICPTKVFDVQEVTGENEPGLVS